MNKLKTNNLLKKLTIIIVTFLLVYYWLNTDTDKFNKSETIFSCNFIEQFVEIYHMDKICNTAFSDGRISRSEYWSVTWRLETITRIWDKQLENGEGKPALKIHAKSPIERRVLPLPHSLEIPELKELMQKVNGLEE